MAGRCFGFVLIITFSFRIRDILFINKFDNENVINCRRQTKRSNAERFQQSDTIVKKSSENRKSHWKFVRWIHIQAHMSSIGVHPYSKWVHEVWNRLLLNQIWNYSKLGLSPIRWNTQRKNLSWRFSFSFTFLLKYKARSFLFDWV